MVRVYSSGLNLPPFVLSQRPRVLGVDPGVSGAVAVVGPGEADVRVWDTPTHEPPKAGRRVVDFVALMDLLLAEVDPPPDLAVVEMVGAMRGDGASQAFAFGKATGAAMATVSAVFRCPIEEVAPQVWKRAMRIPTGAGKDASRARATALFPAAAWQWPLKKHDGRAEAVLLAEFQRRRGTGHGDAA